MRVSFVVTAFDIETYIGPCLAQLGGCLRPGDQLIVVDDGSGDRTVEEIEAGLAQLAGRDLDLQLLALGTNTPGGVGIPANVGLRQALQGPCEALFFVDGDDLVAPEGVNWLRYRFAAAPCDLLLGNYLVREEPAGRLLPPPDAGLWARTEAAATPEARRELALQMVGVPWRKLYRMAFLRAQALAFPEGDFFFEDGPFHWQACLRASDIRFADRVVCQHRIGRAGQTMAARGMELAAFFDHYDRIAALPGLAPHQASALRWLLENMAWHADQLAPEAHWAYAARAQESLARVPRRLWRKLAGDPVAERARAMAMALARGELAEVVAGWQGRHLMQRLSGLEAQLAQLTAEQAAQGQRLSQLADHQDGQRALQEFRILKAQFGGGPPEAD